MVLHRREVIDLSFNGSRKVELAMFGFLLMVAIHGLLDFGTDKNVFVATGTFGFSVPLAALKKTVGSFDGACSCGPWGIETL